MYVYPSTHISALIFFVRTTKYSSYLGNYLLPVFWIPAKSSTEPMERKKQQSACFTRRKLGTVWKCDHDNQASVVRSAPACQKTTPYQARYIQGKDDWYRRIGLAAHYIAKRGVRIIVERNSFLPADRHTERVQVSPRSPPTDGNSSVLRI